MIDPRDIPIGILKLHVMDACLGAENPEKAEERIKDRFSPVHSVHVQKEGEDRFVVLMQLCPEAESIKIVCER